MSAPPSRSSVLANPLVLAALIAMPACFAVNVVLGRQMVATVSPWSLIFWRWMVAFAILLPFAAPAMYRHRAVLAREWKKLLVLGGIITLLCGGFVYVSLQYTTATNGVLIYTTSTIMVVVLEAVLARRPMPLVHLAGALAGFFGIVLITVQGDLGRLAHLEFNRGDLGILVAAIAWASYSLIARRGPLTEIGILPSFVAILFVGLLMSLPPLAWELSHGGHGPSEPREWLTVLVLAIFPSILAFQMFQYCLREAGASVTAIFQYLIPAFGMIMALVMLGEQPHLYHAAGFVLIIGGVILATRPVH